MKKLLLVLLLIVPFALKTAEVEPKKVTEQELINFVELIKTQKNGWLKFSKEFHDAKFDLLIKQHNEIFDQKIKYLNKFKNGGSLSTYLDEIFKDMVALHEKQTEEWKNLCTKFQEKGKELYESNIKENAKFSGKAIKVEATPEESKTFTEKIKSFIGE